MLEKKELHIAFKVFGLLAIILMATAYYLFADIRETPKGQEYITIPALLPWPEAGFTSEALNSNYDLTSGIYSTDSDSRLGISISKAVEGDDFIEIYESGRKIFRVDYNREGILRRIGYDMKGNEYHTDSWQYLTYSSSGTIAESSQLPEDKNIDLAILSVITQYPHTLSASNDMKSTNPTIELSLNKHIDYPERKIPLLPFERSKQDWNITLKDSTGSTQLIDTVFLWY